MRAGKLGGLFWLAGLLATSPAGAATSGSNATHDPSRIVESSGKFYFCSTSGSCASSTNGLAWSSAGALRLSVPSWSRTYMSGDQGVWAPDLVFFKDRYLIYYSFCGVPASNAPCAIGLLTTPTLDSSSARFKLTDAGMVLNNPTNDSTFQFSTIDPAPVVDATGDLWLVWGSGYGKDQSKTQIWITRMDNDTGLPLTTDKAYKPPTVLGYPLKTGRREGAYIHYRDGYYYLFWNEGSCCSGTSSTYTMWVSRSIGITGPFTGDKVFYASTGNIHGPGHMGIYSACGTERFTYHYYPTATSILGENELTWGADGWPAVGREATTPLVPCVGTGGSTSLPDAGTTGDASIPGSGGAIGTGGTQRDGGGSGGQPGIDGGPGTGGNAARSGGVALDAALGRGGSPASGGIATGAGGSATGGAMVPGRGGGTSSPSGGTMSSGGTPGNGATGGTAGESRSGCSCRFGGEGGHPRGWLVGLLLVAMALRATGRKSGRRG